MSALRKTGAALVTLAAIAVIAHAVLDWLAGVSLWRTARRQRERGLPSHLAEVAPPAVPETKNAALPLREAARRMSALNVERTLSRASRPAALSRAERRRVLAYLASPELTAVRDLLAEAAGRPGCHFGAVRPDRGLVTEHLSEVQAAVHLLCLWAWLQGAEGAAGEALTAAGRALSLSHHLAAEPLLSSQMTRMSCTIAALTCLKDVAATASDPLPEQEANALLARLEQLWDTAVSAVPASIDAERLVMVEALFAGPPSANGARSRLRAAQPTLRQKLYFGYWGRPWLRRDLERFLETTAVYRRRASQPYHRTGGRLAEDAAANHRSRFADGLLPAIKRAYRLNAVEQAMLGLSRIGLLLEAHRRQHGAYPAALDALSQPAAELSDPFTGEPFRYRKAGRGCLLYSVGPDGRDGDARPAPAGKSTDIVWSRPRDG